MLSENKSYWFVGAMWDGVDKTPEFVEQGKWENGYTDKYIDQVNSISVGDYIAIKSSYTKRKDLPFKNEQNNIASVMKIKAIGKVTENLEDGRILKVEWEPFEEKEWYFFTGRSTVWEVKPTTWIRKALVEFTFNNSSQEYDKFRNAPFWKDRFGDKERVESSFKWTAFYQEFANKLLNYKNNRTELVNKLHSLSKKLDSFAPLNDHYKDGGFGPVKDICPFSVIAIFNRGITTDKRVSIAKELASFLGVEIEAPVEFESIPVVNNQKTWFFGYEDKRMEDDIDILWDMFEQGLKFADSQSENYEEFVALYDKVNNVRNVAWNITQGLYWIRPWDFPTLDSRSRDYIRKELGITIKSNGVGNRCSGEDYLNICEELKLKFEDPNCSINSYPELSLAAWNVSSSKEKKKDVVKSENVLKPQNIILYGPPGTGKTYNTVNKSLDLILGQGNTPVLRADQKIVYKELVNKNQIVFTSFHQSLSYEDFVEGIKPNVEGENIIYKVVDGIFKEISQIAEENWSKSEDIEELKQYVLIIDEINRGNVASIFGELITLLEPDKRAGMKEELSLKLPYSGDEFTVPPNLHIIGTMNTADRSVEALDVALRRRFSFEEMMPNSNLLSESEFESLGLGIDLPLLLETINNRIMKLKDRDHSIGHSYFYSLLDCNDTGLELKNIFSNKIIPLLEEFFYSDWEKIGMILGESFVSKVKSNVSFGKGFSDTEYYDDFEYTISKQSNWNFRSIYE